MPQNDGKLVFFFFLKPQLNVSVTFFSVYQLSARKIFLDDVLNAKVKYLFMFLLQIYNALSLSNSSKQSSLMVLRYHLENC